MAGRRTHAQVHGRRGPMSAPVEPFRVKGRRGNSPSAATQDDFDETLRHERREAAARADRAEAQARAARAKAARDERPPSAGPRRRRSEGSPSLRRASRSLRRIGTRHPRRALVAELLAVMTIRTVASAARLEPPRMADYVAPFAVFLILGFMTELGDQSARLASGLGALIVLATLLAHGDALVQALSVLQSTEGKV